MFHPTSPLYLEIPHKLVYVGLSDIINIECAALSLGMIPSATPEVAVTKAIIPFNLTLASITRYKKVFCVSS